ncbi:MAG: hypothetical protein OXH69_21750 [Acidobacteria bacterium]|nr:hypothetical protein [Acidobacteriota bacterium]
MKRRIQQAVVVLATLIVLAYAAAWVTAVRPTIGSFDDRIYQRFREAGETRDEYDTLNHRASSWRSATHPLGGA